MTTDLLPPEASTPASSFTTDYLSNIADSLNITQETTEKTPVQTEALPVETPPVQTETSPSQEKPNRPEAQRRVEAKTLKAELEQAKREIEELRASASKLPELETQLTEFRTLAEQRAAEKEELEKAYRNEASSFPDELLDDLPEVKEAQERFSKAGKNLFPVWLNDTNDDSDPDIRFNLASLDEAQKTTINRYIGQWEEQEYRSTDAPAVRGEAQRVIISQIAKTLGVNPNKFVPETFRGHEFDMLPKTHPVFKHLRDSLRPFVEERGQFAQVRQAAVQNKKASLTTVQQQRVNNTRTLFTNSGVGVTGDSLQAELQRTPDSPVLQTMKVLEGHEDLMTEIRSNMDLEATVNGVFRPYLDLLEEDPGERSSKAQMALGRIGKRAVYAPMAEPLMKLVLRQQAQLDEERRKREAAEAEASESRIQGEPGSVGSSAAGYAEPLHSNPDIDRLAQQLGIKL